MRSWITFFILPNFMNVTILISSEICLKDHLKWSNVKNIFTLSNFLLKNASVLKKFVIISKRRRSYIFKMNRAYKYLFPLYEKLSGFPRSPTNSVVSSQEWSFYDWATSSTLSQGTRNVELYFEFIYKLLHVILIFFHFYM